MATVVERLRIEGLRTAVTCARGEYSAAAVSVGAGVGFERPILGTSAIVTTA